MTTIKAIVLRNIKIILNNISKSQFLHNHVKNNSNNLPHRFVTRLLPNTVS